MIFFFVFFDFSVWYRIKFVWHVLFISQIQVFNVSDNFNWIRFSIKKYISYHEIRKYYRFCFKYANFLWLIIKTKGLNSIASNNLIHDNLIKKSREKNDLVIMKLKIHSASNSAQKIVKNDYINFKKKNIANKKIQFQWIQIVKSCLQLDGETRIK